MKELFDYQKDAVSRMDNGCILCGDVGSGKSITGLYYYDHIQDQGCYKNLYIITTAKKRESMDWEWEMNEFGLSTFPERNQHGNEVIVDSWNNIKKYISVKDCFFIFDEYRSAGDGVWAETFIEIAKHNQWILLSATPGDCYEDYASAFIANGFYETRDEFNKRHLIYDERKDYPKVIGYRDKKLIQDRIDQILVNMQYERKAVLHSKGVLCDYPEFLYQRVAKDKWDIWNDCPIENRSQYCVFLRKVVNSDPSRCKKLKEILKEHPRCIVFYSFDYELDILRSFAERIMYPYFEWNGHNHDTLPRRGDWLYFVQYTAGAEGWNCTSTNTVVFYSLDYSYKTMKQAAGRIDRMNSPFDELFYFRLQSDASIDKGIRTALSNKQSFNEANFLRTEWKEKRK